MSELINPGVEMMPDVPESVESVIEEAAQPAVNYSEKNLAELVELFEELVQNEERMKMSKEAEAIKAAFYKRLQKEKVDAGLVAAETVEPADEPEETVEEVEETVEVSENPFAAIERGFKEIYNRFRKERAEYNRQLEKEREKNLALKETVIADLKALLEKQEDVNATFPEFREIQNRWRAIGPVPAQSYRNINETYQLYVEQFYDMVKINRELRDLDFKKNLEAKEEFCALAEKLAENPNVIEAFRDLQKLHEQWKEFGPVAKEYRDQIWDRFKAATAVVNKKYQAFFEGLKEQQAENLAKKTVLCEKVEEIAEREVSDSNQWNAFSKEIEDIQKEWRTIGFASKKDNQKIYDRFRAACDKFYGRKRDFYNEYKDSINQNMEKKISLCEAAEALKSSTEWKKATDQFINLQKQWKEIGAVPRKKSEQLWKRFRAACDEFFAERDKNARPENDFYGNLKAKQRLIEEIKAYVLTGDAAADQEAMKAFQARWQEIGFVPFKEKEKVQKEFNPALDMHFADIRSLEGEKKLNKFRRMVAEVKNSGKGDRGLRFEREKLLLKYRKMEQDIATLENNMGFFARTKNADSMIADVKKKISIAKEELARIEEKIRIIDNQFE